MSENGIGPPPGKGKAQNASPSVWANPKTNTVTTTNLRTQDSAELPRRRAESWRHPVLDCGRSDPWWYEPPTAGYELAAAHLLERGLLPAPNREGLRRMWRSGNGRRMAGLIAERWELAS